jgi:cytochrome c-type biogenesis protein CcmH
MLATCSSPGAAAIRDSIQKMAEGGLAADSIIEAVLAQYGQQWRATPPSDGTGLWAWLVPPVVLALGLSMVGVVLARRERSPEAATATAAPSTEDDRRLRDAMRALDEEEAAAF